MVWRFLLTLTLAAGCGFAQGGRGGGGGGMGEEGGMGGGGGMGAGGMEGGGMPRMQRLTKPELFADKLKLNRDQKEQAQAILVEAAQKARPIVDQINRGRQLIGTALIQKKSEADLKPLMDTYTAVSAQMTAVEAEAFGKIYAILKPNQQKNAAQSFEILGGMFMPVQTAGRGMGRSQGMGGGQREGGGSGRGGRN